MDFIPQTTVSCDVGEALTLPETVEVVYNDRSANTQVPVSWDASQAAAIDTQKAGTYTVDGTLSDGTAITADVDVEMVNYVKNPGFEEADRSMWQISYTGENDPTDYQEKADDAHDGDFSLHFWSDSDMEFSICQTLTDLPGRNLSAFRVCAGRRYGEHLGSGTVRGGKRGRDRVGCFHADHLDGLETAEGG